MSDKYEYMLHTWGGFYNEQYRKIHNESPGYLFFDTKEERDKKLQSLRAIESKLGARHLVHTEEEGTHVRYKTIAKIIFVYNGKEYPYEDDLGYAYPVSAAEFMYREGDYSCDCNRSIFLQGEYGADIIDELECGDEIQMKEITIIQVKDPQ